MSVVFGVFMVRMEVIVVLWWMGRNVLWDVFLL